MRTLMSLIAGLIGVCFGVLSPASAENNCAQWRVPQDWNLTQDNGFNLNLKIQQDKNQHLRGQASYWNEKNWGDVDGQVSGDRLTFAVYWSNNAIGDYNGTIDSAGHVQGFTQDRNNKSSTAGFHGQSLLSCAKWETSSPPPEASTPSSGPQPSPDTIMHKKHEQAGTSSPGSGGVLVPEPSSGPSPFGPPPPPPTPRATEDQSVGEILKENQPLSQKDKLGITREPGMGVGDFLKEQNPDAVH